MGNTGERQEGGERGEREVEFLWSIITTPIPTTRHSFWLTTDSAVEILCPALGKPPPAAAVEELRWLSRGAEAPIRVTLFVSGRKKGA